MTLKMKPYSHNYTLFSALTYLNEFIQCTAVLSFSLKSFPRDIWCTGWSL